MKESYIYESPDGGHTVYRRLQGQNHSERILHSISNKKQCDDNQIKEDKLWVEIRCYAKTDPVLRAMLDKTMLYYKLKNSP